jgi:hypothetical protein
MWQYEDWSMLFMCWSLIGQNKFTLQPSAEGAKNKGAKPFPSSSNIFCDLLTILRPCCPQSTVQCSTNSSTSVHRLEAGINDPSRVCVLKQARQIEQESGTLMHILGTREHTLCLEQLYGCLFQPLYNVHL